MRHAQHVKEERTVIDGRTDIEITLGCQCIKLRPVFRGKDGGKLASFGPLRQRLIRRDKYLEFLVMYSLLHGSELCRRKRVLRKNQRDDLARRRGEDMLARLFRPHFKKRSLRKG